MKTLHSKPYALLFVAIIAMAAMAMIPNAAARDTDIYLKSPGLTRDDAPNVLLIIDTSGSMESNSITTRPPYYSTIDYCSSTLTLQAAYLAKGISIDDVANTSGCAGISGRIYYAFPDEDTGEVTPPGVSSDNWFSASKNECIASDSALGSSGGGIYSGTKIARWKSGDGWRRLREDSEVTYVDCQADGTTDGQTAGDGNFPKSSGSAYTTNTNNAFDWSNFTGRRSTPTLYNANYMNYVNNTGLQTSQTRMQIAKSAVKSIIDANRSVRFGLMIFNRNNDDVDDDDSAAHHGGRVIMKIDTMTDARRSDMKTIVDNLNGSGWTPLAETLWEARRYLGGLSVYYGDNDLTDTPLRDITAESPQPDPASGSEVSVGNYVTPFRYGCQKSFIIYVTDGAPTRDHNADSVIWSGMGKTGAVNCSSTVGTSPNQTTEDNCLNDLAYWMHNNDVVANSILADNQTVATYTVGFDLGIDYEAINLLTDTAAKGGGKYYTASNADSLVTALQSAITGALQQTSSFTAPSLSINAFNQLYNRDDVYFALFRPSTRVRWIGNVKKYRLCNTSDVTTYSCTYGSVIDYNNAAAIDVNSRIKTTAKSYWSSSADGNTVAAGGAGSHITTPRTLHTYRGSYTGLSSTNLATPVTIEALAGNNSVYDAALADPTILGLAANASSDVAPLISWMRGDSLDVTDDDDDGDTAEARWNYADPLHSRPVAITFGGTSANPIIKIFSSTNDGILRIVNNSTGVEEWAFIPKELLAKQNSLKANADGDHVYGLDDTPTFWIIDNNKDGIIDPAASDKVYMYIGMRRGTNGVNGDKHGNIYAFDMTPAAKLTSNSDTLSPKLMWVIEGGAGNFARLGQTWSRPKVVTIRYKCSGCGAGESASKTMLIFGGGYDPNQDIGTPGADTVGNAIYLVEPLTGARWWWASNTTSSDSDRAQLELTKMKYSIPSELTLLDTNGDGAVDRLYVGDTAGQLWRIDLGNQIAAGANGGSDGYVFADVGCDGGVRDSTNCSATADQNRRKFFYPPDVAQVSDPNFSSSTNYDLVTIASGNREDPLDFLTSNLTPTEEPVHNRIYGFRDYNYKTGTPTTKPNPLTDNTTGGDLYDATDNKLGTLTGASLDAQIAIFKASKGYFIDMVESSNCTLPNGLSTTWWGEKGLAKTVIFNGILYVTTYVPANSCNSTVTCSPNEGVARLYAINYLDATPEIDMDKDGDIDTADRVAKIGGGIPSEPVIVIREGGTTGLVGTGGGASTIQPPTGTNRYRTYWYDE